MAPVWSCDGDELSYDNYILLSEERAGDRVIHKVLPGSMGEWDPVFLALLIVNATFMSVSALILMGIARTLTNDVFVETLAPFLYLGSYVSGQHLRDGHGGRE